MSQIGFPGKGLKEALGSCDQDTSAKAVARRVPDSEGERAVGRETEIEIITADFRSGFHVESYFYVRMVQVVLRQHRELKSAGVLELRRFADILGLDQGFFRFKLNCTLGNDILEMDAAARIPNEKEEYNHRYY